MKSIESTVFLILGLTFEGLDIQLKVLQALPSLLQNYANSLTGDLLGAAFQVCFLLHNSKTAVVSNTAAASLQQLVYSTFEKVATEDGMLTLKLQEIPRHATDSLKAILSKETVLRKFHLRMVHSRFVVLHWMHIMFVMDSYLVSCFD